MTGPYGAPSWFAASHQHQLPSSDRVRVASRRATPQSSLPWVDLSSVDLNEVDLNEVDLNEVDLNEVDLNEVDLTPSDCLLTGLMFRVHRHDGGGHREKVGLLSASHHGEDGLHFRD